MRRVPLDCVVRCPVLRCDVRNDTLLLKELAKRFHVICSANKQDWPYTETAELLQPIPFTPCVTFRDARRNLGLRQSGIGKESLHADVVLLADFQFGSFYSVWIAKPMWYSQCTCNLHRNRCGATFFGKGLLAHFFGYRANLELSA